MQLDSVKQKLSDLRQRGMKVRKSRGHNRGKSAWVINGRTFTVCQIDDWAYEFLATGKRPSFQSKSQDSRVTHIEFLQTKISNPNLEGEIKNHLKDLHLMSIERAKQCITLYSKFLEIKELDMNILHNAINNKEE